MHEEYQKLGIGASLIHWGTDQADRGGLETYLDASEVGLPYYVKWHGFEPRRTIDVPDRPAYGSFHYVSVIRAPQTA